MPSIPSERIICNADFGLRNGDRELIAVVRTGHGHSVATFAGSFCYP
jgi:hypothetical protein